MRIKQSVLIIYYLRNKIKEKMPMRGIKISGTGIYLPETVVKNDDFARYVETNDEWISSRTGISERRFSPDVMNYQMAAEAAKKALENSGTKAEEIDLILVSTCSPEFFYPNTACLVQHEIGAVNSAAYDISAACTGFICALDAASRYLTDGDYKKVLVIASERLSNHIDFTDRSTCVLFGDGAAAAVVEHSEKPMYSYLNAKGDPFESLYCHIDLKPNCPFHREKELPAYLDTENKRRYIQMNGKEVYKFAVDAMATAMAKTLEKAGLTAGDIDLVIPHQANIRIIQSAMKQMKLPDEKVYINIQKRANTSSVCIPTCLDELNRAGRLKTGMKICLVGFGAGLTSGAIIYEI